jgi:hypothetical protein
MSTTDTNLITQGLTRIVGVLTKSTLFSSHITAALTAAEALRQALRQLYTVTDIDASEGVQLDNIGRIIGQPRRIEQGAPKFFFGFEEQVYAYTFGEDSDPTVGGPWYNEGDSMADSASLDDQPYRLALKARVLFNATRCDVTVSMHEALIQVLELLLPGFTCHVQDTGGMHLVIGAEAIPTAMQQALLLYAGILPIASGVGHSITVWNSTADTFGFEDTPGDHIVTFAEDDTPGSGGVFAEEIR